MLITLGLFMLLGAVGNAGWAAKGGHFKSGSACAIDAVFGAFIAAWLILQ